jgi:hypothetical protein
MQARVIQVQARRGPARYGPAAPEDRPRLDDPGAGAPPSPSAGRVIEGEIEDR